jgi:cytochrome c5
MVVEGRGTFRVERTMKKPLVAFAAVLALAGCAPSPKIPVPTSTMAIRSGEDLAVLQKGYGVYMAQCTRCHEPMMPSEVSAADWHIVTPGMAWNAGISEADEAAVLKYILAAK